MAYNDYIKGYKAGVARGENSAVEDSVLCIILQ